jgi:aspartate/methionine/tyrosine aminotransferase
VDEQSFSRRTAWDTAETEWARALRERRAAGLPIFDLTASNPTRCGFAYDAEAILGPLRSPAALIYDPNPRGLAPARAAVASYYADHGAAVSPENIFLTTSTSEAYSFVFRLLCDPGDEVLIAQPSYPLFEFLAALDDVRLVPYPLFYDYGWHLDPEALRQRITPRTRALAVVHPNNPTGHFTKAAERAVLEEICAAHGLALVLDEVFLDYPLGLGQAGTGEGNSEASFSCGEHPVLTFVLSGLSKIAALPQMKAAWIACFGPQPELQRATDRLEVIADTFLSMNAPVQLALPQWLASRNTIQSQIRARTQANLALLDETLEPGSAISRLEVEAGWYAILRIPDSGNDEEIALQLLQNHGVAIHSGHFFGFRNTGWLVASVLTRKEDFSQGVNDLQAFIHRKHSVQKKVCLSC